MALFGPVITIKTGISLVADHGRLTSCSWKRRGRSASTAGKDSDHETAWGPGQQRRRAALTSTGTAVGSRVMAPGRLDTAAPLAMAVVSLNTTTNPATSASPATATT